MHINPSGGAFNAATQSCKAHTLSGSKCIPVQRFSKKTTRRNWLIFNLWGCIALIYCRSHRSRQPNDFEHHQKNHNFMHLCPKRPNCVFSHFCILAQLADCCIDRVSNSVKHNLVALDYAFGSM